MFCTTSGADKLFWLTLRLNHNHHNGEDTFLIDWSGTMLKGLR
jgi:hypothetical protein